MKLSIVKLLCLLTLSYSIFADTTSTNSTNWPTPTEKEENSNEWPKPSNSTSEKTESSWPEPTEEGTSTLHDTTASKELPEPTLTTKEFVLEESGEAGKYERKSVSFLNALWLIDNSTRGMPPRLVEQTLERIKEEIMMPRFDFNPLSTQMQGNFIDEANNSLRSISSANLKTSNMALDSITEVMNRTIVPKVLEVVDAAKEMRAQNLLTEQQKNSFITDKAKELGITAKELEKVMNSAYLFIPVARNYAAVSDQNGNFTASMDLGIIWWRISTKGEKARAIPVIKKFTKSFGFSKVGSSYIGIGNYRDYAYHSLMKNGARNLKTATQEIPEFRLSAQIIENVGGKVGFNLGTKEGLKIDHKYKIVEFIEEADGSITQESNGWVLVTSVADTNSKYGYKSEAQVIAGNPALGEVISEYPRIPIDITVKFKKFAYNADHDDLDGYIGQLKLNGGSGFEVDATYNIGSHMGIPQLFFDFGFGMGFGDAEGVVSLYDVTGAYDIGKLETVGNSSFEFSLLKKLYMRRIAIVTQAGLVYQDVNINTGSLDVGYLGTIHTRLNNASLGFFLNTGAEVALHPAFNIGGNVGYQMGGTSDDWTLQYKWALGDDWTSGNTYNEDEINHSGMTFQIYFTYSPPALPFDPIDLVRGKMGI